MIFKPGDIFVKNYIVSENTHSGFISLFNDHNPLHTDEKFAVDKGFKERVMHGNILNGFISNFIGECLPTKDVIIHSQEIQFKNPVYMNDELVFYCEVCAVHESVQVIEFKYNFKNLLSL